MLQNYWYIACAASRLEADPRRARILEQDLVLFRDGEGKAHALLDRCCHRGVKLSLGKITNGNIACAYHGWQYDGSGRCVHIPSLVPDAHIAKGFEVPAFPCVEQESYIWVWMGEGAPEPALPPAIPGFDLGEWRQGVSMFEANASMVIENQFDICHPAFTHEKTHPAYFYTKTLGFRDYHFEVRTTGEGFISFYPAAEAAEDPIPEKFYSKISFHLPGRVVLHQTMLTVDFFLVLHVVPTGPNSSRMEWMQRKKGAAGVVWVDEEPVINAQDRVVMESSQPWYDACGRDFEHSVEADYVTLMVRRCMALAEAGNWQNGRATLQPRRVLNVRN